MSLLISASDLQSSSSHTTPSTLFDVSVHNSYIEVGQWSGKGTPCSSSSSSSSYSYCISAGGIGNSGSGNLGSGQPYFFL